MITRRRGDAETTEVSKKKPQRLKEHKDAGGQKLFAFLVTFVTSWFCSFSAPPRLRVSLLAVWVVWSVTSVVAAEIDPIKIALHVDGMASKGSGYEAAELHGLGVEGLAAVLNHLLPDTAPPEAPMPMGPP